MLAIGLHSPVTAQQANIVTPDGIPEREEPTPADPAVDALLGYRLPGDPQRRARRTGRLGRQAGWGSAVPRRPSSLDLDTGRQVAPCGQADATMT
jgi:hypothetical protein